MISVKVTRADLIKAIEKHRKVQLAQVAFDPKKYAADHAARLKKAQKELAAWKRQAMKALDRARAQVNAGQDIDIRYNRYAPEIPMDNAAATARICSANAKDVNAAHDRVLHLIALSADETFTVNERSEFAQYIYI